MQSKIMATYDSKRISLPMDFKHDDDDDSPPLSPLRPGSASTASDSRGSETPKEPASGPQRARSASTNGGKEKRKRSRVTPDQLVHLERFFSVDRSPTATRRREISELLGMQERQTQIWFQNRRAKAKLQDGKNKARGGSAETPPDTPPELSTGFEIDLHNLIHEDEPVTIIPCTDLSIGTWRRIATTVGKHDLIAYVSDVKRCLTWFIHSAGYGFKMEIPFDIILDTEFTNAAPGSGLATFLLSHPPLFYLEDVPPDPTVHRTWKRCADWTEGQQASKIMRHDLIGSAVQLAHLLRNLHVNASGSDIHLHSPSYIEPSPSPMELPQPPMAGLAAFAYRPDAEHEHEHGRRRSYSGPAMLSQHAFPPLSIDAAAHAPHGPASAPYPPFSPAYYPSPVFSDFSASEQQQHSHPQQQQHPHSQLGEYGTIPISHLHSRSSSTQPPRSVSACYPDDTRLYAHTHSTHAHAFRSPSPPLLTTPFHPPTQPQPQQQPSHEHTPEVSASGLPGVRYDYREDLS